MLHIWNRLTTMQDERGASIVEYALLIAFIAIVSIAVLNIVGGETSDIFSTAGDGFP